MDDTKIQKPPAQTHTTIHKTAPASGGGTMWFILGGVIAVLAFVIYFMFSAGGTVSTSAPAASDGGNVSVNVDANGTAPADSAPAPAADPAPTPEAAPEPAAPVQEAPVETAPQAD